MRKRIIFCPIGQPLGRRAENNPASGHPDCLPEVLWEPPAQNHLEQQQKEDSYDKPKKSNKSRTEIGTDQLDTSPAKAE